MRGEWVANAIGQAPAKNENKERGSYVRFTGVRNARQEAANGAARFAYSDARLSASDEARSAALERDPRVYTPDADETATRLCGASKHNR